MPLLCHCGAKLVSRGIDRGCQVYECSNSSKCGNFYRLPQNEGKSEFPLERILRDDWTPPAAPQNAYVPAPEPVVCELQVREYNCKVCGTGITKEQAMQSYERDGKAMCPICAG